ncbi:MAG: hypothetical protein HYW90_03240 [Candidatus Sungbacteria bacterium]|nr:hypothetical protein [Candidatus Sungbacteria bacterium]
MSQLAGTDGQSEQKLEAVKSFVRAERARRGIREYTLWEKHVPGEPSCEMKGEGFNLVDFQLMYTKEGFGAWRELEAVEILDLAYQYVTSGRRG